MRAPRERNAAAFCKQGFGALVAALGQGLNIQLSTPAKSIDTRRGITVETARGAINARAAIVTVPTNVIASGGLKFNPDLGHHQIDAFGRLSLGSYDHIALELIGNPLGLESDDLVFEKSTDTHTAAILANVSGTELCLIDVAGAFGRDLSAQGEAAMIDFAVNWLAGLYGSEIKSAIGRKHATRWNAEPYALGAWSAAVPGGQFARRQLLEPIADDVWYAGEAAHETLWGTVGGAWESGERAADAVLRRLGPARAAAPAEAEAKPKLQAGHARAEHQQRAASRAMKGSRNITGGDAEHHRAGAIVTPAARRRCACRLRRRFLPPAPRSRRRSWSCSRGWIVTAMAIDFLPGSMPLPS